MNRPRFTPSAPVSSPSRALSGWRARLASDPIPRLLREGSPSVLARIRRDLIDDSEAPGLSEVWAYPEVKAIVKKVEKNGAYAAKAPDKALGGPKFAAALATLRTIDRLTDLGVRVAEGDKSPPELSKSVDFLLESQEPDGGIADLALADTPKGRAKMVALHFQGWAMSALCRLGLEGDRRVERGLQFLLERRQDDGGWAWRGVRTDSAARPSSHLVTGMVLRAFASATARRGSREARRAAELLATRFLQPDRYPDRKAPGYWELLTEPRFYTDVLDALDTVTAIGLGKENSGVRTAEAYLRSRQSADGLWHPGPPPSKADSLGISLPAPAKSKDGKETRDGKAAQGARDLKDTKETEASIWLTLRVLVVLRRIN
jgi:Prenyltransferase and squalene oxidase repeat